MNAKDIRALIVVAIVLQILWFFILPAGNQWAPRSTEMAQALKAFETNRSAATEAALLEQVHRDNLRLWRRDEIWFGLMLLTDVVVIYFFWNFRVKSTAKQSRALFSLPD